MEIIVLGTGCAKCGEVYATIQAVIDEEHLQATLLKEEDMGKILSYQVLTLPAVVVNGKVKLKGIVPTKEQIRKILKEA